MKSIFFIIMVFGLIAGIGCRTAKKAQRTVNDSAISSSPAVKLKPVDSAEILKNQLMDVANVPLNFTTFYGRAKASFSSPKMAGSATVYIKMLRDSIIWISITGPLNIEGARVLVTPDSVKIINKLENTVQLSSIKNLQKVTKLPLGFSEFQHIILGKAVLNGSNNFQVKKDSITVTKADEMLRYMYSFTRNGFLLGQSNFQTINNSDVTGANIFYNDYHTVDSISFSAGRDIAVTGKTPSSLTLNFKDYNFNQPQSFVFTISKNYRVKYD
ncbi:DUF4292 domain-containing protein [Parafilimonas sp.]|uniref:DUF4292 domain-containing protein n=1 Tax=Parafilimonas sp. TaxID=1969739 RepID=UPI0039E69618